MSTKDSAEVRSIVGGRTSEIDADRFARALSPALSADRISDGLYRVTSGEETYTVSLDSGACDCPDHQFRGDEYACKHALLAALSEVISEGAPRTEFVACVVGFAREHGCPEGNDRLCDGPLGPRLPCPSCIDGLRSESIDEFDVWQAVVTEDRA